VGVEEGEEGREEAEEEEGEADEAESMLVHCYLCYAVDQCVLNDVLTVALYSRLYCLQCTAVRCTVCCQLCNVPLPYVYMSRKQMMNEKVCHFTTGSVPLSVIVNLLNVTL